ncbi:MAG: peptidase C39 family protein [Burkholderiales bacterium RIFCSPLOWO2_12_FULL_61_40]|nr:MAG: peptidase C39 family protein [Burkholderiales bacterium RIFCSPLOWO2_12_FULL_61_40]
MWSIIFLAIATGIGGFGVATHIPPVERPAEQFDLPMVMTGGGTPPQPVDIEPFSVAKFRNIVHQAYDYSCGSAALVTVLNNYLGLTVTEQDAMEGMLAHGESEKIVARRGFSLLDMKRYVITLGVDANGFRGEMSDLAELQTPAIVPIDYAGFKHFVVFRGIREGKVYIADPSAGHVVFSVEEFATLWDRNTLFLLTPPKDKPPLTRLSLGEQELGVMDGDLIRSEAVLPRLDPTEALQRAVQSNFGNFSLRK